MNKSNNSTVKLSLKEEIINAASHGIMALLSLCILPFATVYTYENYSFIYSIGVSIFFISLFLMFLSSTLYHSMKYDTTHKFIFRKIDHSSIFLAIAGTYTPVILFHAQSKIAISILWIQWALVIIGILLKFFLKNIHANLSLILYIAMGWSAIFLIPYLFVHTSTVFLTLITIGGVLYTIGTFFYMKQSIRYFHTIWHFFINLASIAHMIAIVFFIA